MQLCNDPQNWNDMIARLPGSHVLQTWQWASIKRPIGWQAHTLYWGAEPDIDAAALVLERSLPLSGLGFPLRILYSPKGPLFDWKSPSISQQVLDDLHNFSKQRGALFIKIDPDIPIGTGIPGNSQGQENLEGKQFTSDLQSRGWRFSPDQIQFRHTIQIDLSASEDDLLKQMKAKTRYNVRLAKRKGVIIRHGDHKDLEMLYQMYATTALRDGFTIRPPEYYHRVWSTFMSAGMAVPLLANVENQPVAALILFFFANKAWFLYGMSTGDHREKMPNYLLQWEAIKWAKNAGYTTYDLWGAPDVFSENDPLWGVYRFKRGFNGQIIRHIGAWDLPLYPRLYRFYIHTLPSLLAFLRRRGRLKTRRSLALDK